MKDHQQRHDFARGHRGWAVTMDLPVGEQRHMVRLGVLLAKIIDIAEQFEYTHGKRASWLRGVSNSSYQIRALLPIAPLL